MSDSQSRDIQEKEIDNSQEKDSQLLQPYGFFNRLLGHPPDKSQISRFDRIAQATRLDDDDGLWYYIYINEFYDERLSRRLQEIDSAPETAIRRAEEGIKKMVRKTMEEMAGSFERELAKSAERQNRWSNIRSWGLLVGALAAFFAVVFNAGYVMGAGQTPFWFHPRNRLEWFCSLFFLVPSGWIIFVGSLPYAFNLLKDSCSNFSGRFLRIFENGSISLPALRDLFFLVFKMGVALFVIVFSCLFFLVF
jgi:hypothetical protein